MARFTALILLALLPVALATSLCAGIKCAQGQVCAGGVKDKRCVKPMPVGGKCNTDPFWVCAQGLKCVKNICEKDIITVKPGDSCDGKTRICPSPTKCVGPSGQKKCKKLMGLGESCADPFWVCKDPLVCKGEGKNAKCVEPVVTVKPGDSCDGKTRVCPSPTKCVGPTGKMVCKKLVGLGESCADKFSVCKESLECTGKGKKAKCKKAVKEVGRGKKCDGKKRVCRAGLECVKGVCEKPTVIVGLGKRCDGKVRKCEKGLVCKPAPNGKDKCLKEVGAGKSCKGNNIICKEPLICKGKGRNAKCSK